MLPAPVPPGTVPMPSCQLSNPCASQGLEKYLLTKLYDRTFGADPWDRERDAMLGRRLAALQFVTPAHLEVSRELQVGGSGQEGGARLYRRAAKAKLYPSRGRG